MRLKNSVANFVKQEQGPEARVYSILRLSRNMIVNNTECITWQQTSIRSMTAVWIWIVFCGVMGVAEKGGQDNIQSIMRHVFLPGSRRFPDRI
jgi:hypothetical protein